MGKAQVDHNTASGTSQSRPRRPSTTKSRAPMAAAEYERADSSSDNEIHNKAVHIGFDTMPLNFDEVLEKVLKCRDPSYRYPMVRTMCRIAHGGSQATRDGLVTVNQGIGLVAALVGGMSVADLADKIECDQPDLHLCEYRLICVALAFLFNFVAILLTVLNLSFLSSTNPEELLQLCVTSIRSLDALPSTCVFWGIIFFGAAISFRIRIVSIAYGIGDAATGIFLIGAGVSSLLLLYQLIWYNAMYHKKSLRRLNNK